MAKNQGEIQELTQALEILNTSSSQEKMRMKLKEDKIQKLETEHGVTNVEEIQFLK